MTARLTDATKNGLLSGTDLATLATHVGLHTGFPPSAGNELTGGSPVYARQPIGWAAPAAGCRSMSPTPETFEVPAGSTVRCVGLWNALTVGTLAAFAPAGSGATIAFGAAAADLATNDLQSEAHGLAANDTVVVWPTIGATLPNGLAEDTIYFVLSTGLTVDSFRLSLTQGGAAVDITGAGDGDLQRFVAESFAGQGQYQVSSLQVCLPG
jgi:hypothetical protein